MHNANSKSPSRSEILAIIETYEGLLSQDWNNQSAKESWTAWKARLQAAK